MSLFGPTGGADFSPCRRYRYYLWRRLAPIEGKSVLFIMLNPSSADEKHDDPTIRRCIGYASAWGFTDLGIANIFALRSTDPHVLYTAADPVGEDNDYALEHQAEMHDLVVCAWGVHGLLRDRSAAVRKLLARVELHYLRLTNAGEPGHPLYLPADLKPTKWAP
jgi:hypothetical protein